MAQQDQGGDALKGLTDSNIATATETLPARQSCTASGKRSRPLDDAAHDAQATTYAPPRLMLQSQTCTSLKTYQACSAYWNTGEVIEEYPSITMGSQRTVVRVFAESDGACLLCLDDLLQAACLSAADDPRFSLNVIKHQLAAQLYTSPDLCLSKLVRCVNNSDRTGRQLHVAQASVLVTYLHSYLAHCQTAAHIDTVMLLIRQLKTLVSGSELPDIGGHVLSQQLIVVCSFYHRCIQTMHQLEMSRPADLVIQPECCTHVATML